MEEENEEGEKEDDEQQCDIVHFTGVSAEFFCFSLFLTA